jgi:hypothetical protein
VQPRSPSRTRGFGREAGESYRYGIVIDVTEPELKVEVERLSGAGMVHVSVIV